jgi:hypothetical protein
MGDAGLWWPALFAGLVAVLATVAIERLGGRLGGVIGSAPTTVVPAAFGMYAAGDVAQFRAAITVVPAGMLVNALFLWTWRVLPQRLPPLPLPRLLAAMSVLSLGVWTVAAVGVVLLGGALRSAGAPPPALGAAALLAGLGFGLYATWRPLPAPVGGRRVSWVVLALRGVLAACAIAVAITIARAGSPLVAGVASIFPAIFLTTMVSLWLSQGQAVPAGATGPMMLGATSVGVFALLAAWWMPALGPWAGAGAAWAVSVGGVSVPVAVWLRR